MTDALSNNEELRTQMGSINLSLDEANSQMVYLRDQIFLKIERVIKVEKERDEAQATEKSLNEILIIANESREGMRAKLVKVEARLRSETE